MYRSNSFITPALIFGAKCVRFGAPLALVLVGAAALPASAATVSFSDNFTPSPSPLWNNYAGNWTDTSGQYYAQAPNNNPSTYSGLPYQVTDYTLTVTLNNLGDARIWVRGNGTDQLSGSSTDANGIALILGGNGYGQGNRVGNADTSVYWVAPGMGSAVNELKGVFTPGDAYTIRVTAVGDTFSAYVNNSSTPVTTLVDSSFAYGKVGLYDDQPNGLTRSGFGPPTTFSNFSLQGTVYSIATPEPASLLLAIAGVARATLISRRKAHRS
ncbi:MAG: hypothetical protein M3Y72_15890 [Acidobacteriota bacterium]|nr:hypothetical protein [Acidobacteriota bacterium]